MTPIERFLSRLQNPKATGKNRWMACCPAHEDKTPSLSITETDDARVLIHCFAGCAASDVVASIGLGLGELFPDRQRHEHRKMIPHYRRMKLKAALDFEMLVLHCAHADLKAGKEISGDDFARVQLAASRSLEIETMLREGAQ